ncbi:MAG TPA: glycosyltransferase [Polyangiaceae bacterium]
MTGNRPHRMLVVHNMVGAGDPVRVVERKPFRKYAFGNLLAHADEVARGLGKRQLLSSDSLAVPSGLPVYGGAELQGIAVAEKYDSIVCHLVLDHGGVVGEDFFAVLRSELLAPGGSLLNAVESIAKTDVARASSFKLEAKGAPCVIKKDDNYNKPETVFQIRTQAELEAWRSERTAEEQSRYVMHQLLRYHDIDVARLYQVERWYVFFDDLTVNYRCADEFFVKIGTSLSYYVRDERRMASDLERLAGSGYKWRGRAIDCSYSRDPEAWDARYAVMKSFRAAFRLDYAELDVIQPAKNEFVVVDVNNTPGASCRNAYWKDLAVRFLAEALAIPLAAEPSPPPVGTRPRTNICLCMIVKNETEVLPRLFRSLKDYIDYYVIVDTGSTDDTIELIKREMGGYGIPGEVHEREWVNFGVNRQQALELAVAAGKADWLLFIDADEELAVGDPKFYEKLEPGVSYDLEKHHGHLRYRVPHLVNVKGSRFRWEGPVHNYLLTLEGPQQRAVRKDVWIIYHQHEGAKSRGVTPEQKYLRDAQLLEDDLSQNPDNPRSQFYLAQSYRDAGHPERAYVEYKKRARMSKGWAEERYVAQLEAARMTLRLEKPEEAVVREFLEAFDLRPSRIEPLHDLARYFRLKGQYGKAYVFARTAVEIEQTQDSLFVSQDIYDWRMLDELGVAAFWIGDYPAAREAFETVLARVARGLAVPAADLQRIRDNLGHTLKKFEA